MSNIDKLRKETKRKADLFKHVFGTPQGKEVLQAMKEELDPDSLFVDGDAHKTTYNVGRRDAFIFVNQMLRFDPNE